MKKNLLLAVIFCMPFLVKAQSKFYSVGEQTGNWSDYYNEWQYNDHEKYLDLTFTIDDDIVYVNDGENSIYHLYDEVTETNTYPKIYGWTAYDEDWDKCEFQIVQHADKTWYIRIIYGDRCYRYRMSGNYEN